jgi:hypothetical protein
MSVQHFSSPGFEPERPGLEEDEPEWKESAQIQSDLEVYFGMKNAMQEQLATIKSGDNDEYTRAENALLMCQRVDLWCAGPKVVERAVQHLYKLGRKLNEREVDFPTCIAEFDSGVDDLDT